jgi:hypothetical protein
MIKKSAITSAALLALIGSALPAWAENAGTFGVQQSQKQAVQAAQATQIQASNQLQIFAMGVQKYVYANAGQVPWNVQYTQQPVPYTPFLIYAAGPGVTAVQAQQMCGFAYGSNTPPGFASPVNLSSPPLLKPTMASAATQPITWSAPAQYLPASWSAPMNGVDCATVWINSPSAKQISVQTYYVPASGNNSNTNVTLTPTQVVYGVNQSTATTAPIQSAQTLWKSIGTMQGTQSTASPSIAINGWIGRFSGGMSSTLAPRP